MEMDVGMLGQPVMIFLMGAVIVEDDMHFLIGRSVFVTWSINAWKSGRFLVSDRLRLDLACGHIQGREQVDGPMSFVSAFQPSHDLSITVST